MNVSTIIYTLWDSLKKGELVLVERTDSKDQYLGAYHLITWGIDKGYNVVVVDVLDTFHILKAKARLAGIDIDLLEKTDVIKIGGRLPSGNVVKTIEDVSEPVILTKKFRDVYEAVLESKSPVLTIVLGLEKLLMSSNFSPSNVHALINLMSQYIGDERRLSVYLMKTGIIGPERRSIISLLEDMATTVIRVSKREKATEFQVIKSIAPNLEDTALRI